MPEPLLRALELSIGRRVDGLLAGEHRSSLLGRGSELAQVRLYVPGDDVRLIESSVAALRARICHLSIRAPDCRRDTRERCSVAESGAIRHKDHLIRSRSDLRLRNSSHK